jgi:hypothetical protein
MNADGAKMRPGIRSYLLSSGRGLRTLLVVAFALIAHAVGTIT